MALEPCAPRRRHCRRCDALLGYAPSPPAQKSSPAASRPRLPATVPTTSVGRCPDTNTCRHGRSIVGISSWAPVCASRSFSVWPWTTRPKARVEDARSKARQRLAGARLHQVPRLLGRMETGPSRPIAASPARHGDREAGRCDLGARRRGGRDSIQPLACSSRPGTGDITRFLFAREP